MNAETAFVLRPMRLVALLDTAFRLYRRNFWTLIGIVALLQIPISLLTIAPQGFMLEAASSMQYGDLSPMYFLGLGLSLVTGILQFFLVSGVATAALTRCIVSSYLGQKIGIAESFRQARPIMGRFIGVLFLTGLLILGLYIWTLVPCVGWVSGIGMLLAVAMAVIPMTAPVIVVENTGVRETLSRTWDLLRRRFWWIIGLAGALYLLNLVLAGPSIFVSLFFSSFSGINNAFEQNMMASIGQILAGILVAVLYLPLQITVFVLAYFDLRARTEGLDLFVNNAETVSPEEVALMPKIKLATSVITGREFGYFVILSLGFGLVYAVLVGIVFGVIALFSGL